MRFPDVYKSIRDRLYPKPQESPPLAIPITTCPHLSMGYSDGDFRCLTCGTKLVPPLEGPGNATP